MNETKKSMKDYLVDLLTPDQKTKFASAFKFEVAPAVVAPVNAAVPVIEPVAELKTKDGTVVKYSTPTPIAGETVVTVVSPDGELPAPVGEVEMENGDVLIIGEGGILAEVKTAEVIEPAAEVPMAVTKEAMDEAVNSVKSQLDTANKTIAALVSRFDAQSKEVKQLETALVSFSTAFNELMGTSMAAPIETPTNKVVTKRALASSIFHK